MKNGIAPKLATLTRMLAATALLLLCSCGGDDTISRRYPCRFTFHTEWHPTSMIVTALNTYNYFVRISMTTYHGAYVINSTDNNDKSESITLTNDVENLAYSGGIYLGAGGSTGSIILGSTNFNGYVAWDGMCPNCVATSSSNSTLQWTDNDTQVECPVCHRTYSLETGAILSGSDGDRLMQYIVNYVQNGVLSVGN